MPIQFEIKELGPLSDTSFEFHPFLLFSGESNMGKSYVGFLVYSFFLRSCRLSLFTGILFGTNVTIFEKN